VNPILFILALIVGAAHLWQAGVWTHQEIDFRDAAPLAVPHLVIGVAVLIAAGLGMGGVLT
jgi:hypothetical protein